MKKKSAARRLLLVPLLLVAAFFCYVGIRAVLFAKEPIPVPLSFLEQQSLENLNRSHYAEHYQVLKELPFALATPALDVQAASAILVDFSNGNILYEKNADEVIPPASMTKLFTMYVVEEEVAAGRVSYDTVIPLVPESWACNMPPHSSLMFLGEGQRVTLEELLLGLSVCSGNDAAYALAYALFGSMENMVARMNGVAAESGLAHTHFVESSGYSELNTTTAREMSQFALTYLKKHPDSLTRFHGVERFRYPKEHNLASGDSVQAQDFSQGIPRHITMPITQYNTNPLLGRLEGCDGLKTGYIEESGYNLALTATRNGTRYLSVTMRGPGANSAEGQAGRVHDGTELMEWAFFSFADAENPLARQTYTVRVFGGTARAVGLVPAFVADSVTVPFVTGETMAENLAHLAFSAELPDFLDAAVEQGAAYGFVKVQLEDYVLEQIPLVADRTVREAGLVTRLADALLHKK